ncbi:NGG1p interacting factor NIF3 [Bacillus aerolatus]|uniref:GTP cyclohydrolase 1 type 2 homolog n=1 Tax=Bacillus aerolatus TaxID=2653354 RepID=A0A6I1FNJ2_9BACI|nr:Nif3-like dinuclear metal center hexameric protein [Bacillus aerolatus]KAB7705605.1 NGG1p interacting factor NIF3 [Bacillus aerolatus]
MKTVGDVLNALDELTGGRVIKSLADITRGDHPFVIMKSSNLPGKEVIETPGLVYGDLGREVKKVAVAMTMTEGSIELAGATGVDAIIAHHPIAEAANSGGVTLKNYLDLYNVAVFELHEAFHGLHPGISFLHGHEVYRTEITYGGVHGDVLFVGKALQEARTLGDILNRLDVFMGLQQEEDLLFTEKEIRSASSLTETSVVTRGRIMIGEESTPVNNILHIFPHTGFSPEHLRQAVKEHPEADTVLSSISRVYDGHALIETAKELGLNFIIGNCHVLEILENGLPLAYALDILLPGVEVVVFRERVTSQALNEMGTPQMKQYAEKMATTYLVNRKAVELS